MSDDTGTPRFPNDPADHPEDEFTSALAAATSELEALAEIRSPAGVRARGDQRRRRHQAAVVGTPVLLLAVVAAAVLAARPAGGAPVTAATQPVATAAPTPSATSDSGAPAPTSSGPTPTAPGGGSSGPANGALPAPSHVVHVNLAAHTLTLDTLDGKVLRTVPITAGGAGFPTPAGTFRVSGKLAQYRLSSTTPPPTSGSDYYTADVQWYLQLDPRNVAIYAMPWQDPGIAAGADATHGDVGLHTADAAWLYANVQVGDQVVIAAG